MRHFLYAMLCPILFCSTLVGGETLRKVAGNRVLVGCAIATVDIGNPKLIALVAEQFDCITPEYELMPGLMVDDDGKFTFERGDRIVAFAESQHMPVFGHMLVWHFVSRKWLFEDQTGKPLPREKALLNLKNYIDAVMGHYKGRIRAWCVVNEAISDKDGEFLKDTPARRAIGEDYVERAFEYSSSQFRVPEIARTELRPLLLPSIQQVA